jgi:hypothetical protein
MPKISELAPGTRFLYPDLGIIATLVSLGPCGARILEEGPTTEVEFRAKVTWGEDGPEASTVAFARPRKPVIVSDYSDVEVING